MLFFNRLRSVKRELKAAGADVSFVKKWQKIYDKVRKQSFILEKQYQKSRAELETVLACLEGMEYFLISGGDKVVLRDYASCLKKYQNSFEQEFLINHKDEEFHLIYQTILTLCETDMDNDSDKLMLQSEVENLMAIVKETLERQLPDFRELAYYYFEHSDEELSQISHQEKIQVVKQRYEEEFYHPMTQVLEDALGKERAEKIMGVEIWIG